MTCSLIMLIQFGYFCILVFLWDLGGRRKNSIICVFLNLIEKFFFNAFFFCFEGVFGVLLKLKFSLFFQRGFSVKSISKNFLKKKIPKNIFFNFFESFLFLFFFSLSNFCLVFCWFQRKSETSWSDLKPKKLSKRLKFKRFGVEENFRNSLAGFSRISI